MGGFSVHGLIRLVPRVERPGLSWCAAAGCAVGDMMVIGCLQAPACGSKA